MFVWHYIKQAYETLWYYIFYIHIQRKFPQPGTLCYLGEYDIECMVISNHFQNKVIVLQCLNFDWKDDYLLISLHWPSWYLVPIFTISHFSKDGIGIQSYTLPYNAMYGEIINIKPLATSMIHAYNIFHDNFFKRKDKIFKDPHKHLNIPDWHHTVLQLDRSTRMIQKQWKLSISCPMFTLCRSRLYKEFHEMYILNKI